MYRRSYSSRRRRSSHSRAHRGRRRHRSSSRGDRGSRRRHGSYGSRSSSSSYRRSTSRLRRVDSGHRRHSRRDALRDSRRCYDDRRDSHKISDSRYERRDVSDHDSRRRRYDRRTRDRSVSVSRRRRSHHKDQWHRRHRSPTRSPSDHKRYRESNDRIVHFKWEPGMMLDDYRVVQKIGDGTFGRVLHCEKNGEHFAVKVVRDVEKYVSSAKIEVDILMDIRKVDVAGESHCVVLHDHFMFKRRIMCLVFEQLGDSLYDFLKRNDYKGFFMADIQKIAYQLLKGLAFLKKNRLIHTDLKPENILLTCGREEFIEVPFPRSMTGMMTRRPATADIKIIDFGSTIYEDDYHSTIINTRQYRSPEVILDIGWSYASDMWSLGCILIEIYTGDLLFNTHSHLEHLAMMEQTVGRLPASMLEKARTTDGRRYLHPDKLSLNWPDGARSRSSVERVKYCSGIMELVKPEHRPFAEFIKYILNPDPEKRPTPEDAMEHEFLVLTLPEN
ncbi:protein serine/threonine kinase 1, putative [Babesia bigemina]|uniref:Protein serine/threonine kinase 1, putative n=1 Tax=Babesia bigemina TaxID=5866 RepID=A0A061DDY8_BABBI|nr:protein serine/threonine kinase 1, putative [Babesia bigemina]CDR97789.1 protein serine/threonine kinase 1, putative [Babesia bigemina]|eukprot:XP_012769975.1 protein serine/threonine kinase 1, putative [Babesia bigemina]